MPSAEALLLGFEFVDGLRFALFGRVHVAQKIFQARRFDIEVLGLARQDDAQQAAHLLAQFGVAPRLRSLALERGELLFDFDENVVDARKIDFRGFEFRFGEAPLRLVHRDSGGFFDDGAAVHRLGIQDLADAALLDDGVAVRTEADAHENFLDVAEARHAAVDDVFALAGAIEPAADHDFAGTHRDGGLFGGAFLPRFDARAYFSADSPAGASTASAKSTSCASASALAASVLASAAAS